MTKEELKDEMKNRISMALKDPILQQGFEIICKNLVELEQENAELEKENKTMRSEIGIAKGYIERVEKENAELKEQNETKDIQIKELQEQKCYWKESSFDWRHKFFKKDEVKRLVKKDKQLTKAKELLNEFMRISKASDEDFEHDYSELISEAERFLSEEK